MTDLKEQLREAADAISYLREREKRHMDRIEELEAQVETLQNRCARRGLSPEDSDALQAENERLRAVYEAAQRVCPEHGTHWNELREALAADVQ